MKNIDNLVKEIIKLKSKRKTLLIGIDGRGGAGKTTLALRIKEYFPEVRIVTTDDFYNKNIEKIDEALIKKELLEPLSKDKRVSYNQFLGLENKIVKRIIDLGVMVIVEGIYAIHSSIANFYDYKIWIESDVNKANSRVKKRDKQYDEKWEKYHRPNEDQYIIEDKPQQRANIIIKS